MQTPTVVLPNGKALTLSQPYGHEVSIQTSAYSADLILSPINKRVQLLSYNAHDVAALAKELIKIANENEFGKIWVKARKPDREEWERQGYVFEGELKRYFADGQDAAFVAYYSKPQRLQRPELTQEEENLLVAQANITDTNQQYTLPEGYTSRLFQNTDAVELAKLYHSVFPTYPYPVNDPKYLIETAQSHILYRLVFDSEGKLVAAASAETDPENRNSEMTDFATDPHQRGKGLAQFILQQLEKDAEKHYNIRTFYTIARIANIGVMRTFFKCGYKYKGLLTNNCTISGQFESMVLLEKDH
ncbi:MAG: putative beta-lysine N-acetyltransferase [Sumerlaeia bacterium]